MQEKVCQGSRLASCWHIQAGQFPTKPSSKFARKYKMLNHSSLTNTLCQDSVFCVLTHGGQPRDRAVTEVVSSCGEGENVLLFTASALVTVNVMKNVYR